MLLEGPPGDLQQLLLNQALEVILPLYGSASPGKEGQEGSI